jgi:MFS family permease
MAARDDGAQARFEPMAAARRQNPHYVLAILYLVCVFSYVDRQLIALLAPAIQKDLALKDWQVGFVSGTAFAVLYVFVGIPLSRMADRVHRIRMLAICLVAWSVMTAACGAVGSFMQLALARVGVAIGEAGGYPPSLSVLSDVYPAHKRATATSIFLSGTTAGGFLSLVVGGALDAALGWRWTFVLAAIPGLLITPVLFLTVREPVRGQSDPREFAEAPAVENIGEAFRVLFARPLYRWVAIALAFGNIELFSLAAWTPSYAQRAFALGPAEIGLGLGLALGVGSGLVMIVAGRIADRLTLRSRAAAVYIAIAGQILFIPIFLWALEATSFPLFCVAYALAYGAAASGGPMTIAATQSAVPPQVRGMAAALLVMIATLAGYGLGPPLIGAISDFAGTGSPAERLRTALAIGTLFNVACALLLLRGAIVAGREPPAVPAA